eukprot:gene23775-30042_t
MRDVELKLDEWEVRIRGGIFDVAQQLTAIGSNATHMKETIKYKVYPFDKGSKQLTREKVDEQLAKQLGMFRKFIEQETLPEGDGFDFKMVAYAVEEALKLPAVTQEDRQRRLSEQRELRKSSKGPRRKTIESEEEESSGEESAKENAIKRKFFNLSAGESEEESQGGGRSSAVSDTSGDDEDDHSTTPRKKGRPSLSRSSSLGSGYGGEDRSTTPRKKGQPSLSRSSSLGFGDDGDNHRSTPGKNDGRSSLVVRSPVDDATWEDDGDVDGDLLSHHTSTRRLSGGNGRLVAKQSTKKAKRASPTMPLPARKKARLEGSSSERGEDIDEEQEEEEEGEDEEAVKSFLHNSALVVVDGSDPEESYMTSITFNGKNLMQAISQRDNVTANVLCDAIFEETCVDDVLADLKHNIIREQNVVAFNTLKRRISTCPPDSVVLFDFNKFFKKVYKRSFDKLKMCSVRKRDGGSGALDSLGIKHNDALGCRVKASVHRIKLKCIYTYAHLNNQVDTLDLTQFKGCGFLTVLNNGEVNCTLPLTKDSLLEITGHQAYTPQEMEDFKEATLCKTRKLSEVKAKEAAKRVKQTERNQRKAAAKTSSSSDPAAVTLNGSPTMITASVDPFLMNAGPMKSLEDDNLERLTHEALSSPVATSSSSGARELPVVRSAVYSSACTNNHDAGGDNNSVDFSTSPQSSPEHLSFSSRSASPPTSGPLGNSASVVGLQRAAGLMDALQDRDDSASFSPAAPAAVSSVKLAALKSSSGPQLTNDFVPVLAADGPPSAAHSSSVKGGDDAVLATLLKSVFKNSEGVKDHVKIIYDLPQQLFKKTEEALCLIDMIMSIHESPQGNVDPQAILLAEDGYPFAYHDTLGDGFCLVRSTLQAQARARDHTLTTIKLKEKDSKVQRHKEIATHIKLYEMLFNAENFPDQSNPKGCWGDQSMVRFLPFDFAMLDFTNTEAQPQVVDSSGRVRGWGRVAHVPFHYFQSFFGGSPPKLTVVQLHHTPSDVDLLGGAVIDWIARCVPRVRALSETQVEQVRTFRVMLKGRQSDKEEVVAPPSPSLKKTTSRGASVMAVDVLREELNVSNYDSKRKPLCQDGFFKKCENGAYDKSEVDELFLTLKFLRERVSALKEQLVDGGKGTRKSTRSAAATTSSASNAVDLLTEDDEAEEVVDLVGDDSSGEDNDEAADSVISPNTALADYHRLDYTSESATSQSSKSAPPAAPAPSQSSKSAPPAAPAPSQISKSAPPAAPAPSLVSKSAPHAAPADSSSSLQHKVVKACPEATSEASLVVVPAVAPEVVPAVAPEVVPAVAPEVVPVASAEEEEVHVNEVSVLQTQSTEPQQLPLAPNEEEAENMNEVAEEQEQVVTVVEGVVAKLAEEEAGVGVGVGAVLMLTKRLGEELVGGAVEVAVEVVYVYLSVHPLPPEKCSFLATSGETVAPLGKRLPRHADNQFDEAASYTLLPSVHPKLCAPQLMIIVVGVLVQRLDADSLTTSGVVSNEKVCDSNEGKKGKNHGNNGKRKNKKKRRTSKTEPVGTAVQYYRKTGDRTYDWVDANVINLANGSSATYTMASVADAKSGVDGPVAELALLRERGRERGTVLELEEELMRGAVEVMTSVMIL